MWVYRVINWSETLAALTGLGKRGGGENVCQRAYKVAWQIQARRENTGRFYNILSHSNVVTEKGTERRREEKRR